MKRFAKGIVLAVCAVLLVAGSVMGTMAWLTSRATVTNTFTVGQVSITMDEKNVDGKDAAGNDNSSLTRDTANKYKLVPGAELDKDLCITVGSNSENCYLFVKIENGLAAIEDQTSGLKIADQLAANGWKALNDSTNIYYLENAVAAGATVHIFEKFYISNTVTDLSGYSSKTIVVTAYAVQADGFDTAQAAWTAAAAQFTNS